MNKNIAPGAVSWSVARLLGMQAIWRSTPMSGTFFLKGLVMKIFLLPFFILS